MTNVAENLTINEQSVDGVLGIWTRVCMIVGAHKSTELWHFLNNKIAKRQTFKKNQTELHFCEILNLIFFAQTDWWPFLDRGIPSVWKLNLAPNCSFSLDDSFKEDR